MENDKKRQGKIEAYFSEMMESKDSPTFMKGITPENRENLLKAFATGYILSEILPEITKKFVGTIGTTLLRELLMIDCQRTIDPEGFEQIKNEISKKDNPTQKETKDESQSRS